MVSNQYEAMELASHLPKLCHLAFWPTSKNRFIPRIRCGIIKLRVCSSLENKDLIRLRPFAIQDSCLGPKRENAQLSGIGDISPKISSFSSLENKSLVWFKVRSLHRIHALPGKGVIRKIVCNLVRREIFYQRSTDTNRRQFPDLIRVEQQLFQRPCISQYLIGHNSQAAVTLVDVINIAVTSLPERHTLHHLKSVLVIFLLDKNFNERE